MYENTRASRSCFHTVHRFLVFGYPGETLALVVHILLYNPVYNQMCLHRSWILINHCAGKLTSKPIAGIILQILPCQLADIKLQLTPNTGWTILYYYSRHWHRSDYKYGCYYWDIAPQHSLFLRKLSTTVNTILKVSEITIQHWEPVAESHFFRGGGGQSLLNFRQNYQISDIPPICIRKDCF
jgi:hypothetical protein